jgi:ABC-type branched-subunit amino acid transport system ATPase component
MNYGEKIADGSAKTVMDNEVVKSAYLGTETE